MGDILAPMRLELTRRGDYGVRAMLALARSAGPGPMSARRIAEAMAIPPRFLPQVLGDLARAGLIQAHPGRLGGYRLAQPAEAVTLLAMIEAVEGDSRRKTCVLRSAPCGLDELCDVHDAFFAAQDAMLGRFQAVTLAELATRRATA